MADGYWNRPQQYQQQMLPQAGMQKRPRTDYGPPPIGLPAAQTHNYLGREDERSGARGAKDTKTIGSAYDQYLQSAQNPPFTSSEPTTYGGAGLGRASEPTNYGGAGLGRAAVSNGMPAFSPADPFPMGRPGARPDFAPNGRGMEFGGRVPMDDMARSMPLPPDASSTLYIEGLPSDSRRREVAHIFRPFVGYKEVRLVSKESKHRGDPLILCFVDFINPACAATALGALQGYKMDEHDPDSPYLRLQFSKNPGPRSGSGPRGRR